MIYETYTAEETKKIGYNIGKNAKPSDVFCLLGDLGVGKTVITKGIAEGLGIKEVITSPTFTIVNEYREGNIPLFHFDTYRIADADEMLEIGFEDYLYRQQGICVIEWANTIESIIPKYAKWIKIEKDLNKGEDYRRINIE